MSNNELDFLKEKNSLLKKYNASLKKNKELSAKLVQHEGLDWTHPDFFDLKKNPNIDDSLGLQEIAVTIDGKKVEGKIQGKRNYLDVWNRSTQNNDNYQVFSDLPRLDNGMISYTWLLRKICCWTRWKGERLLEERHFLTHLYNVKNWADLSSQEIDQPKEIGVEQFKLFPYFILPKDIVKGLSNGFYISGSDNKRVWNGISPIWMKHICEVWGVKEITPKERGKL